MSTSNAPSKTTSGVATTNKVSGVSTSTPAAPVKILRPGKVVILLNGRYAGHKAFIVNPFEGNPSKTRPYSHALVVGVKKAPMPVTKAMNKRKIKNRSRVKAFVKVINYNHIMPTRYSIDVDLKNVVNLDVATDAAKRKNACSVVGKKLEEKYKNGGSKWFFSKLRF